MRRLDSWEQLADVLPEAFDVDPLDDEHDCAGDVCAVCELDRNLAPELRGTASKEGEN